jgi:hypothetical protein
MSIGAASRDQTAATVLRDCRIESRLTHECGIGVVGVLGSVSNGDDADLWDDALQNSAKLFEIKIFQKQLATAHVEIDVKGLSFARACAWSRQTGLSRFH